MPTNGKNEISLYFHVPFCTKKCEYCHFFVLPDNPENHKFYLNALKKEWHLRRPSILPYKVVSIYFGGGTPSLLQPEELAEILSWIPHEKSIEITLEANPENLNTEKLCAFKEIGINRLSLGVQSLHDDMLKILGRTHSAHEAAAAVKEASKAGFHNISIDLMYDLPYQTQDIWEETLKKASDLPITHLSLYNLTFEPEAVFFKKQKQLTPHLPPPEESLKMYLKAHEYFENVGLIPYEISAFAKGDAYSRHNTGYWTARPFFGLGPSAFSYFNGDRFKNISHLGKYAKMLDAGQFPVDFIDTISIEDRRKELLAVELRLRKGVHLPTFETRHGSLEEETLQAIDSLEKKGWIQKNNATISLTQNGVLFYDSASAELI